MTANKKLAYGAGMVVFVILIYTLSSQGGLDYPESVIALRAETDDFMKSSQQSPLPDSVKTKFRGLNYFPIDPKYKVRANLEKLPGNQLLEVGTSDGATEEYTKYAYAIFQLKGLDQRVLLLKSDDENGDPYLFLPFGDRTNGEETYGGGRYLDLEFTNSRTVEIDFNLAYNPYCAYNPEYSCPLPPSENRLALSVKAGERNFD